MFHFFSKARTFVLSLSLLLLTTLPSFATHLIGGDIHYRYLSGDQYVITMTLYRDCNPGNATFGDWVDFEIFNGTFSAGTFELKKISETNLDPNLNRACAYVSGICYQYAIYRDTVTLPNLVGGITLSSEVCNRANSITNIVSPDAACITLTADVPYRNSSLDNNDNPKFKKLALTFVCLGYPFKYDFGATDKEGDSLVYNICEPLDTYGDPVNFKSGFSAAAPFGNSVPFNLNPKTGVLSFTPVSIGNYVFAICVSEYRKGKFLGITRRDMQVSVTQNCGYVYTDVDIENTLCGSKNLKVNSNSSIGVKGYKWDFGDPTTTFDTSSQATPSYTYAQTGTYTVKLISQSQNDPNCADTTEYEVNILPDIEASFGYTTTSCSPRARFTSTTPSPGFGIGYTYDWRFGDGGNSTVNNPSHVYPAAGNYTVTLTVMTNTGKPCVDTAQRVVPIQGFLPFNAGPDRTICSKTLTTLGSNPVPQNVTFEWSPPSDIIGSNTAANPSASYLNTGTSTINKTVYLKATSTYCTLFDTLQVTVKPSPKADFELPSVICPGKLLTFKNNSQQAISYRWEFNGLQDISNDEDAEYTIGSTGPFSVKLIAFSDCGSDTIEKTFTVNPSPNKPVVKGRTRLCTSEYDTLTVTGSAGGSYKWTRLGNSTILGTGAQFIFYASFNTTYVVQANDPSGCPSSDTIPITVNSQPNVVVTGPFSICKGDTATIKVSGGNTFKWATTSTPGSVFSTDSTIKVTPTNYTTYVVTVTDLLGCSGSVYHSVDVNNASVFADFTSVKSICVGENVYFNNTSGSASTFKWDFGGQGNSTNYSPNFTFNTPGIYLISLIAEGFNCGKDTAIKTLEVTQPKITPSIATANTVVCQGTKVTLTSNPASNNYTWYKLPGSFPIASTRDYSIVANSSGTYAISVMDDKNCVAYDTIYIETKPSPNNVVVTGSKIICENDSLRLTASAGADSYKWARATSPFTYLSQSRYFNDKPTDITSYIFTAENNNGCIYKDTFNVFVNPLPKSEFTITEPPCPSVAASFINTTQYGNTYRWEFAGLGTSTQTSPTFIFGSSNTFQIKLISTNNCGNDTVVKSLALLNTPVVEISALQNVCLGSTIRLYGSGANNYVWYIGDTTNRVSTANSYSYVINATTTFILKGSIPRCVNRDTLVLTPYALPTVTSVKQKPSTCPGDTNVVTIHGGPFIEWRQLNPSAGPVFSYDSIVSLTPAVTTSYLVDVSNVNNCHATTMVVLPVNPRPASNGLLGPPYVCPGAKNIRYHTENGANNNLHNWSIYPSGVTYRQFNGDSIWVDWPASGNQDYTIKFVEKTAAGCLGDTVYYPVHISKNYTPPAPVGPSPLCLDSTATFIYYAPQPSNGATYQWFVVGGQVLNNDPGPKSYIRWKQSSADLLVYYKEISATADSACYVTSAPLAVTVHPTPGQSRITGNPFVCKDAKQVEYSLQGGSSTSTYSWHIAPPTGATIVGPTNSRIYTINFSDVNTYQITVTETNQFGCIGIGTYLDVTVNPLPETHVILGPEVICPSTSKNRLYYVPQIPGNAGSRFVWTVTDGKIVSGQNTRNLTVNWTKTKGSGTVAVYQISKDSCVGPVKKLKVDLEEVTTEMQQVGTKLENENEMNILWPLTYTGTNLSEYTLSRRIVNHFTNTEVAGWNDLITTTTPSYADKGLHTDYLRYEYKYRITDNCDSLVESMVHNSIVLSVANNESEKTVSLKWNPYKNWRNSVYTYEVHRKLDSEKEFHYYADAGIDTSMSFNNGTDGFRHIYRIHAVENNSDATSWSNDDTTEFAHELFIPNAFTPNGDGTNDAWVIRSLEAYKNTSVEIFNRWGQKVYESNNYKNTWAGTNDNNKELPDGVYYYILKIKTKALTKDFSGTVTILR